MTGPDGATKGPGSRLRIHGGTDMHGRPIEVVVADGRIPDDTDDTDGADADRFDATGLTVLPGLIDLQVNGAAGVDITAEPDGLWRVAAALPAYGVTAFLPTVITAAREARERALQVFADGPPDGWTGAMPLGLHFEGPMISPARKGAHPPQWLRPPAAELIDGWTPANGVLMATVAPELPGALEIIAELAGRGVVVAVGHTEATAEQIEAAVAAGASQMTHLGNAMPAMAARQPGPVGAALGGTGLTVGVIADGHHLAPATLRTAWRALGPDRLLAVTDTTAALGIPDGPSRLGDQEVVVAAGTVRLADGTLAGSAASIPQCLRVLRETVGCTLAEAVATCTSTAARVAGDPSRGHLRPGARGDITLVRTDAAGPGLDVVATVVGGRVVHHGDRPTPGGAG